MILTLDRRYKKYTYTIGICYIGGCAADGKIDGSVLTAVGELFAFPTLWTVWHGIDKGIDAKLKHGNTEVTIGDLDKTQGNEND